MKIWRSVDIVCDGANKRHDIFLSVNISLFVIYQLSGFIEQF